MTEKRFTLQMDTEWWFVGDNTIKVNEFGYRDDLTGEDKYRGLKQDLTEQEVVDLLNELAEENEQLKTIIQQLRTDNTKQKKKLNITMKENEQLKIALKDKENLINICEKKFKELGYLITCDDDGYVIE